MENQFGQLSKSDYIFIRYEDFLSRPYDELERIYKYYKLNELNESISKKLFKWGYK